MTNASVCDDLHLSPVQGCRGNFDFSLLFKHTLLSAPSCLFLILVVLRFLVLVPKQRKNQRVVAGPPLRWAELAAVACYGTSEVVLFVSWTHAYPGLYGSRASLGAAVLRLLNVLALGAIPWVIAFNVRAQEETLTNCNHRNRNGSSAGWK